MIGRELTRRESMRNRRGDSSKQMTSSRRRAIDADRSRTWWSNDSLLWPLAALVLGLVFVGGGSSTQSGSAVLAAELIALPMMIWAIAHAIRQDALRRAYWAAATAGMILAMPLLQLMPIPEAVWQWAPARVALRHDLAKVGIAGIDYRWSLTPQATERNLYLLLPSIALFFAGLGLGRDAALRLLWWVVILVCTSVLLAFVQLGMPQDSLFNPFPQFMPAMAGFFANRNHQSGAMAVGLVLVLALMPGMAPRLYSLKRARAVKILCVWLAGILILVLPLVKSRAGVIIALVACGCMFLSRKPTELEGVRNSRASRLMTMSALLFAALGIWAAWAWMQVDVELEGSRWTLVSTTFELGFANLPLGSGFGSFVPMFEQATQGALMKGGYINNAHNDFVQWWFEGGWLAVLVIAMALCVLVVAFIRLLRLPGESRSRQVGLAAFFGMLVLVLHSTVDYPLRTPALMGMFGLLAGVFVAAAGASQRTRNAMD